MHEALAAGEPGRPVPRRGSRRVSEAAWALLPGVALAFVLVWTWRAVHPIHHHPAPDREPAAPLPRHGRMTALRRLAWTALALAYVHSVFGAIVRISGSGMGCGEHWPDCNGSVVPTVTSYTVAVEVSHRYLAALLLSATLALVVVAIVRRAAPGVSGPGGVLRPATLALALIVTAALVGMVVVKLSLSNPYVIAVHYSIAMITLAALVLAVQRAGGLGARVVRAGTAPGRTYRGARAATVLAFVVVVLGALTANVPGAAGSCRGFPWCSEGVMIGGAPLGIQLAHRTLAILLVLHLWVSAIVVTRRRESKPVVRAAQVAAAVIGLQLVVAALLVGLHLPPVLQSLHQAVGTVLWIAVFAFAALAHRARDAATVGPVAAARGRAVPVGGEAAEVSNEALQGAGAGRGSR